MRTLSRADLLAIVQAVDVEKNFAFQPHERVIAGVATRVTLCNCYTKVIIAAFGLDLPTDTANNQLLWLASTAGIARGWLPTNDEGALHAADIGCAVVAGQPAQPHGHICVVLPALDDDPVPYVTSAGAKNFARASVDAVFARGGAPRQYYYHR